MSTLQLYEISFLQMPALNSPTPLQFALTLTSENKVYTTPFIIPKNYKIKFNACTLKFPFNNIDLLLLCKSEGNTYKWGRRSINIDETTDKAVECMGIFNKKNITIASLVYSISIDNTLDTDEGGHQTVPLCARTKLISKCNPCQNQNKLRITIDPPSVPCMPNGDESLRQRLLRFLNKRMEYQKEKESLFKDLHLASSSTSEILSFIDTPSSFTSKPISLDGSLCPSNKPISIKQSPITPLKLGPSKLFVTPFSNRVPQPVCIHTTINTERTRPSRRLADDKENTCSRASAFRNLSRYFTMEKSRPECADTCSEYGMSKQSNRTGIDKRLMPFFSDVTNLNM